MRNPKVCGITANECAPVTKTICHKPPPHEVFLGDQVIAEVRSDTEYRADRPIPVDRIECGFAVIKVVMDEPGLPAVDCNCAAAATRIERKVQPRPFSRQQVHQLRRP